MNLNVIDEEGNIALHVVVINNITEIVELLFKYNANTELKGIRNMMSLYYAIAVEER